MNSVARMRSVAFIFTALLFSTASVAVAGPGSPKPWLQKKVEEARKLAAKKQSKAAQEKAWKDHAGRLLDEMLDWPEMTKRSLGRQWKKLDEKQQKEFGALLREMIEASYSSKLKMASNGNVKKPKKITIDWLEEELDGEKAKVSAKVKVDKTVAVLEFRCRYANNQWRVWDVSIDDVSTVRTYRSQFRKLIEKEGFEELLSRMRRKIADIREGRAELGP